jgi:catechol 2,3-dioxygenase-like lactoylglutathione lyase family enzyme
MIQLGRLDHVALRVADVAEASERWVLQFGLTERSRDAARATLSCDDEPLAIELIAGSEPGFDHVGWELARDCSVEQALAALDAAGVEAESVDDHIELQDVEGNALHLLPYREPPSRFVAHVRPATGMRPGRPRKLGHVNFLTGCLQEQARFYQDVLGMRLTDWLGDDASWLHIGPEHHVMALVNKGYAHLHHMAFDVVDIGQMRDALDHVARHGRWLGWGPTRHGVGGNVASYVRIVEEECFVELYCDMEVLQPDHEPRRYEDNRFSSNTWGPLPPRSYFRFDEAAIASERESLETQGVPLA